MLLPRNFPKDGSRPFLLYAYGSYGSTTEPDFDSSVLSLVDRGFGYAIAHVRGGQEMGRRWYDDGKMMHKKNTFNVLSTSPSTWSGSATRRGSGWWRTA
jgi:oligopeptidase B